MPAKHIKSPIKGTIRHQAGQSARISRNDWLYDQAFLAVLPVGLIGFWLFVEILHRISQAPTPIWLVAFLFMLSVAHCIWRIRSIHIKRHSLDQGIDGEMYVAQIIEDELIPHGYRVIHDLVCENKSGRKFNIDHLLVGSNGVFCVETKAWSKPAKGETIATYDGKHIYLNGKARQTNAVGQACALAREAAARIRSLTGLDVPVVPVLVCVGWYVKKSFSGQSPALVVNEQALAPFVKNVLGHLSETNQNLIFLKLQGNA